MINKKILVDFINQLTDNSSKLAQSIFDIVVDNNHITIVYYP